MSGTERYIKEITKLGAPCECKLSIDDYETMERYHSWCLNHCSKVNDEDCWRKFFSEKEKEKKENG